MWTVNLKFLEKGEIYKNKLHLKYTSSTPHNPEAIHSNLLWKQPNNKYVVLQSGCEPKPAPPYGAVCGIK